jgi:hypothetical protein
MVAVPIPRSGASSQSRYPQAFASYSEVPAAGSASLPAPAPSPQSASADWTHYVAAGTLLAGGVLIATGRRRAGVAVAAAGTAMALLEEQETVKTWWKNLPGYLNDAQHFLDKIEGYLKEASVQGQRIQSILRR